MRAVGLLLLKDLRLLWRDPLGLLVTFGMPCVFALLFGLLFSEGEGAKGRLPVAIVDQEISPLSKRYVAQLLRAPELRAQVATEARAEQLLRSGEASVYVVLHRPTEGTPSDVEVVHGPGRRMEASVLQGVLLRAAAGSEGEHLEVLGLPFRLRTRKSEDGTRKQGPFEASLPLGMVWGIVCCASIFGVSMVTERKRRTLERLCSAPLSSLHLLASKALACCLSIVAVEVLLLVIGTLWLDVRPHSYLSFLVATVCTGLGFSGLMLTLAVVSPSERSATGLGWGVLTLLAMVGGGTIPLSQMPTWLSSVSRVSPFSWAVMAVEGALWRRFDWPQLLVPCAFLLLFGACFFAVGALSFRED